MKNLLFAIFVFTLSIGLFADDSKVKLPSKEDNKSAIAKVRDVFKDEYKNLKTADDRKALAKKLLEQATDPGNDTHTLYALISESAKLASEAGDVPLVVETTNLLASHFEGDGVRQEHYRLLKSLENTKAKIPVESLSILLQAYLDMIDELIADDEFNDALMLAGDAERVAKKAKNNDLSLKAGEKKKEISQIQRSMKEVSASIEKLKTDPDDPSVNFAVGKYTCFIKGDWDKGLAMLAKGSGSNYKEAAEFDLAAKDTASILLSADKWWELAEKEKSTTAKSAIMSRAAAQYQKIIGELSGIDKIKAEKRIKDTKLDNCVFITAFNMNERIQKENFTRIPTYFDQDLLTGKPGRYSYDVELKNAGFYYFHIYYTSAEKRPAKLFINKKEIQEIMSEVTGGWLSSTLKWFTYGPYRFKKGKNLIELIDCFAHVRGFCVSTSKAPPTELNFPPNRYK